jgi:adenylate cyclase
MASTRRLTAILAADVAGYSRLMGRDEEGTHERLKEHRHALVDPKIAEHHGRIVKTTGDGMLVEFASVVDAVRCAVEVQRGMIDREREVPEERRIRFRIGINLGDVIAEAEDIYGDGVNVAARLEALAEPGGICISRVVRDQIRDKLPYSFEDWGEQSVKNIARPVRVFALRPETIAELPVAGVPIAVQRRRRSVVAPIAAAVAAVLVIAVVAWWVWPATRSSSTPPASVAAATTSISQPVVAPRLSIVVLPFANMSNDPEQEFFADGIAEDVITALSRYSSLFVIARNSSFTYKGRAVDVKQVGRQLGVRYVLEGSLRKAGNRIRVTAQLVEAEIGKHVWAERYDRDLADIFAVQDEITGAVTIAIAPAIAHAEQQRAMRKPPGSLDAWSAYQRGLWHLAKFSLEGNALSEKFFQRAVDLDPTFAGGYRGLAFAQWQAAASGFQTRRLPEAQISAEALARWAVELDGADAEARAFLGEMFLYRGDHEGALAEAERALTMMPNLADAHGVRGAALIFSGRPEEGLPAVRTCIRLDPRAPEMAVRLNWVTLGLYLSRKYEPAIEAAKRGIRSHPDFPSTYRWLAAALGQIGQTVEAKEALEKATAVAPASFEIFVSRRVPWHRPEDYAHMLEGLRKAGWEG